MADDPPSPPPSGSLNPASMSVADLARMLSAVGGKRVTPEQIMADLEAGAPCLPDGQMNLIHYTAWQLQDLQRR